MEDGRSEAELGHCTLIAFSRALTNYSQRGVVDEDGGVLLCASGSWIPVVGNCAFRIDPSVPAADLVGRADAYFATVGRGYGIKARDTGEDKDLEEASVASGLAAFGDGAPQMLCRGPLPDPPTVEGVAMRPVEDVVGLAAFVDVNAAAYATYGMPPETLVDLFDAPEAVLGDPSVHCVVAWRGAEPLATALVYESDGAASVQWVGTVPAARGAGLGALVTAEVTNLAFARGASSVTLQASSMGEPVYRGLGYETIYRYVDYVRWSAPTPR
jgi:hypothetical protein